MINDRCEARWYLPRFNRKIIGKSIELQMNAARDRPKAEMSRSREWMLGWRYESRAILGEIRDLKKIRKVWTMIGFLKEEIGNDRVEKAGISNLYVWTASGEGYVESRSWWWFSNQTQFSAGSHQSDAVESLGARVDGAIRKRQNFSRCISSWHIKAVLSFLVSSPVKLKLGCNALSAGK